MAPLLELAVLLVVLAVVVAAFKIVEKVKPFIWNAVVGLVVLLVANLAFGIDVAIGPLVLLIVAIGGFPGAVLVLLLALLEVAFVPILLL